MQQVMAFVVLVDEFSISGVKCEYLCLGRSIESILMVIGFTNSVTGGFES